MAVMHSGPFKLESGAVLPELDIAYETYGTLSSAADNAILVFHGLTSTHIAAGDATPDRRRGWWDSVIGQGMALDTERYFIISSNMLGSCYGTTGPTSINPTTGRPYGLDFPSITFRDIVAAQKRLIDKLGIEKLLAVAGCSYGGYLSFQWAVTYPDAMSAVIAMDTAANDIFDSASVARGLLAEFSRLPNWLDGRYRDGPGLADALTALRVRTLKSYGLEQQVDPSFTPEEREAFIEATAHDWAVEFDPVSLVRLWEASAGFDAKAAFRFIRVPVLYILCDTDAWFPASLGQDVMSALDEGGVQVTFLQISSPHGHYATTVEPHLWSKAAAGILQGARSRR